MEGRGRSRARKRKFFSRKRLTSFLLAAAMVCTNIGSDLSTAYAAGSSTDVSFEMRGSDLVTAIEDAIATENVVTPDDLNFTNGKVDDFEGFLFGEGKLYEAYPEMEGGDVDADMRVFVRLPEDADDMYAVTGDEEVIFLYINNSDETVRFRSLINYTKDGEDKVKKTDWVSVRSYESVYGDEEVNVIPDQPETEEPAETPETTVPETEAPVDETTEAPAEEDPIATDSEMTVSMSPNVAALVAAPGDDDAATPSEITGGEETADEPETTAPEESNEGLVDEGNLPEESDPATTPEESQPAEETTPVEETTEVPETTAPAKDPVATEDEIQSAPKPDYSDLVGIGWSGTGKIYTSTLNKLHAFDDVEGWKVEYSITPEGSARIIDGARGVEDGEDLYFGVKNQIGYAVESVLANGEELTADTITDNEDGSQTAWYAVYGVTEEQSIDVVMAETGEHPAYSQVLTMDDGMIITISAEEGVLPEGVTATANRVSQEIENAVIEDVSDEKEVTSFMAYDINLWLGDQLLDSDIWGGSKLVNVTFSGSPISEQSAEANTIEVLRVDTTQDSDREEKELVALQQTEVSPEDIVNIEKVGDAISIEDGTSIDEISFDAEHFTVYGVLNSIETRASDSLTVYFRITNQDVYVNGDTSFEITPEMLERYGADGATGARVEDIVRGEDLFYGSSGGANDKVFTSAKALGRGDSDSDYEGTEFTYIRYYNGNFQYSSDGSFYSNFSSSYLVARPCIFYYFVQITVTDDVSITARDWPVYEWAQGSTNRVTFVLYNEETGESIETEPIYYNSGRDAHDVRNVSVAENLSEDYEVVSVSGDWVGGSNLNADDFTIPFSYGSSDASRTVTITIRAKNVSMEVNFMAGETQIHHIGLVVLPSSNQTFNGKVGQDGALVEDPFYITVKNGTSTKITADLSEYPVDDQYKSGYTFQRAEVSEDGNTLTLYYESKVGVVRYNLTDENAGWNEADDPGFDRDPNRSYMYWDSKRYSRGDEVTVIDNIPEREGYSFIGWFDKARPDDNPTKPADIVFGGDKVTFMYDDPDDYYTFDALWAYISAQDKVYEYDGQPHTIDDASGMYDCGNLDQSYIQQIVNGELIQMSNILYSSIYSADGTGYSTTKPEFTDVGNHTIYVRATVTVNGEPIVLETTAVVRITPKTVTVTVQGNQRTALYNGSTQTVDGFNIVGGETALPDGIAISLKDGVSASASGTDVGQYYMELTSDSFEVTDTNPNIDVTLNVQDGWLKITPNALSITITGKIDSKVYNGNEQSVEGFTSNAPANVSVALAEGSEAKASGTVVGRYPMGLTEEDFVVTYNEQNYSSLSVTIEDGYLDITPITDEIIITAASGSKKYDGTPLTNNAYTYTEGILLEGDTLTAVVSGSITDVGEVDNVVTSYTVMRGNMDVTNSYNFGESISGKLEIVPRNVTLTSASATKKYDGTPLTRDTIFIGEDGFVLGEGATYNVTGSQTEVGFSENTFTYELTANTKAENYIITPVYGKLEVTVRDNLHYEVHYFYYDADGNMEENLDELISRDDGVFGAKIEYEAPDVKTYKDQNYTLFRIDTEGKTIQLNTEENVVNVFYALDEIGEGEDPNTPDDTPDKYQMFVTFAAVNGTFDENDTTQAERVVTLRDEDENLSEDGTYVFTEDRVPASSPVTGYVEPGTWDRDPLTTVLSKDSDNLTFTITYYTRDRFEAKVEFYFDGVRDDSVTQTSEEEYGLPFVIAPEKSLDHNDHHYVLESVENNGVVIGTDPEQNVVKVYYVLDEKGGTDPENPDNPGPDDVPDKYQIVFTYVSADENTGTVTGTTREVYTFKDAAGNYVENTGISPNAIKGHNPVADPAENYAFHYWTVQGQEERDYTVGMTFLGQKVYTTDTTFVAHFAEDKINDTTDGEDPNVPEDPNQPDGIPDIYQIVFTYVTEDATHGTVDGMVTEVRTFPRNGETGEYDTTAAISPNVGVTITTIGRYRFDNWTNGAGTVYDTDDLLRAAGFTEDQTFTAHFYRLSGGGSSGGGGGTSTPGGPYNPGAGPGVTITEPEVPLAPLPTENGGSTVIFDDNVPLAPLPKTGQQSLKTPITMLLAGIFLAFASLTKRKEEN